MAAGFDNPKVKVHIRDGTDFISNHKESFDVIITDAPDPNGELVLYTLQLEMLATILI